MLMMIQKKVNQIVADSNDEIESDIDNDESDE